MTKTILQQKLASHCFCCLEHLLNRFRDAAFFWFWYQLWDFDCEMLLFNKRFFSKISDIIWIYLCILLRSGLVFFMCWKCKEIVRKKNCHLFTLLLFKTHNKRNITTQPLVLFLTQIFCKTFNSAQVIWLTIMILLMCFYVISGVLQPQFSFTFIVCIYI